MGTNYYVIKKKPSLYNSALHIGKSSAGWKFCFHGYQAIDNPLVSEYSDLNINSVDDWKALLNNKDFVILDEYDETISYKDFFDMVEEKQSENNPEDFVDCANIGGYRFSYRDFS